MNSIARPKEYLEFLQWFQQAYPSLYVHASPYLTPGADGEIVRIGDEVSATVKEIVKTAIREFKNRE